MTTRVFRPRVSVLVIAAVLFLIAQMETLRYFWHSWGKLDSYYSHGAIVPFLAAVIVWLRRDKLFGIKQCGSWLGLPVVLVGSMICLIGMAFSWEPLYGPAFLILLVGVVLSVMGTRAMLALALPVTFLLTMIPLPDSLLDSLTSRFSLMASAIAANVFRVFGYSIERHGNIISSSSFPLPLAVGGACSGLKLLIALIMCSSFLVLALEGSWKRKVILLASAFPLSIILNSVRIILIGFVGIVTGSEKSVHRFHDLSGYIILLVCASVVIGLAWYMKLRSFRDPNAQGMVGKWVSPRLSSPSLLAAGLLVGLAVMTFVVGGMYDLPKGRLDGVNVPAKFGGWQAADLPIDPGMRQVLSKADIISKVYSNEAAGQSVQLFIDGALDFSAFHNPHICLPNTGTQIVGDSTTNLDLGQPSSTRIRVTLLNTRSDDGLGVMIYWYCCGGRHWANANELVAFNRAERKRDVLALLAHPSSLSRIRERIMSRQVVWYRFYISTSNYSSGEAELRSFIKQFFSEKKGSVSFGDTDD